MQDFTGEKSVQAGRDIIFLEKKEYKYQPHPVLVTDTTHIGTVLRTQFIQVSLLIFIFIMVACIFIDIIATHEATDYIRTMINMHQRTQLIDFL